jgi:hypothetical protein
MDASTSLDTCTAGEIIRMAGTFAADPEEGETQAAPAELAKGFQGDREHILICEVNRALHHVKMKDDPTEKHRRAAGRRLLEAHGTVPPEKWEKWCQTYINLSFDRITKLMDSVERIRGSNRLHMAKKRAEAPADNSPKGESTETPVVEEERETEPMDFNELIQADIEEGSLPESPEAETSTASEAAETSTRISDGVEIGDREITDDPASASEKVDANIRFGAACLDRARVASTRAYDLKVTAKQHFMAAKTEWMELSQVEREREPWAERCARIAPHVSQRTVDRLLSHDVTKPDDDTVDAEERLKAACEAEGLRYIPPEERDALVKRFKEAAAKRRQEQGKAAVAAREAAKTSTRNPDGVEIEAVKPTAAEAEQARRDRAEAVRVANGGKPAQTRRTPAEKAIFDRILFMIGKAEDEDMLRAIEGAIVKRYPELGQKADEAGLTGKRD